MRTNVIQPLTSILPQRYQESFITWIRVHKQAFLQVLLAIPQQSEYESAWAPLTQSEYETVYRWMPSWAADLAKSSLQRSPLKSPTVSRVVTPAEAKEIVDKIDFDSRVPFGNGQLPGGGHAGLDHCTAPCDHPPLPTTGPTANP